MWKGFSFPSHPIIKKWWNITIYLYVSSKQFKTSRVNKMYEKPRITPHQWSKMSWLILLCGAAPSYIRLKVVQRRHSFKMSSPIISLSSITQVDTGWDTKVFSFSSVPSFIQVWTLWSKLRWMFWEHKEFKVSKASPKSNKRHYVQFGTRSVPVGQILPRLVPAVISAVSIQRCRSVRCVVGWTRWTQNET